MELPATKQEKIKLTEINQYLTCYLCKGYLIDATTISECLHSFCRSCIIKFLQDNSYCPVCELIINKAKPNLKLDKTLQDIVYKLVPELFLKEMLRRKTFYKDYPQIAPRVSPEERGEDTERTIFNPQEMISLSLEYICDDSTPGAIRIPGIATDPETLKSNCSAAESQDSQMKRYLLCPGMCRIEVLKKFVRNKYNVDTNQFFIDVLYKRVPLPDHYTLIDIAYIYSWQRNELMKFFFRIIDRNKAKRTESPVNNVPQFIPRHFRKNKRNGERPKRGTVSDKKSHRKSVVGKVSNGASKHTNKKEWTLGDKNVRDKISAAKSENDIAKTSCESAKSLANRRTHSCSDNKSDPVEKVESEAVKKDVAPKATSEIDTKLDKVKVEKCRDIMSDRNSKDNVEALKSIVSKTDKENEVVSESVDKKILRNEDEEVPNDKLVNHKKQNSADKICRNDASTDIILKVEKPDSFSKENSLATAVTAPVKIKKEPISPEADKADNKLILKISKEFLDNVNSITPKPQVFSKPVTKSYTSITLNRSENVEIITKIEPVSNKDGKPIGHHIIKQTIKKGSKLKTNSPKKVSSKTGQVTIPRLVITKKGMKKKSSPKRQVKCVANGVETANDANKSNVKEVRNKSTFVVEGKVVKAESDTEDEKSKFFRYMNLTPTSLLTANSSMQNKEETKETLEQIPAPMKSPPIKKETAKPTEFHPVQLPKKQLIISNLSGGQKRKNSSPIKNEKSKITKIEGKKSVKIILQQKPSSNKASAPASATSAKSDTGLQSLISNCKIPSSLSITIKESSEKDGLPLVVPPVKNYIEILKLPEESSSSNDKEKPQVSENNPRELTKLDLSKFCDNDSEQKVDQDLSEIAKSLTEKIPMSTTISHMIGPKQQFQIPVQTNVPTKVQIQPAVVPEITKALSVGVAKENLAKLTPRSPQTFQKIFEESLKKPPEGPKTSAVELPPSDPNTPTSSKRNILEIASQLFKKTKLEQDKKAEIALPKVPIPRLPNSRTQKILCSQQAAKLTPQTVANLHSTSLGMNYTVSVGQQSPSKMMKSNGIVSPVKAESVPGMPECKPSVSPLNELKSINTDFKVPSPSLGSPKLPEVSSAGSSSPRPKTPSPKHSPKSSPLVKHMYAPTVPMFNQKVPSPMIRLASLSPKPQSIPKAPSTSPRLLPSPSPKPPTPVPTTKSSSPTPSSSNQNGNASALSPNEILEKYNIQNLAQLTASFNLNPSVLASNQLAAFQHAMLLKHFEMQNRQNWLNRNQGPLLQYEKYLQSLNGGMNGSHSQT